jgi:hypothetical protein
LQATFSVYFIVCPLRITKNFTEISKFVKFSPSQDIEQTYKYTKHEKIEIYAVYIKRSFEIYTKTYSIYDDPLKGPNFWAIFRESVVSHTNNVFS